jgi:GMP synthase (glutamine-hydrolysing)
MPNSLRFLVAESETAAARDARIASTGRSNGESYAAALRQIAPEARCDVVRPLETGARDALLAALADYDAVFLAGSPMHAYEDTPEVRRLLEFMRAIFAAGTPSFGSCAGLQIAVVAAGGTVRENARGHEVGIARRIVPTPTGREHPLHAGRPDVFDALTIHSDEVATLPEHAVVLANNGVTAVQSAEVRSGRGIFWGVQFHPELPLPEVADALRRQADDIITQNLAASRSEVEDYAGLMTNLGRDPDRRDLAWRLGVDQQITSDRLRRIELQNFVEHLVKPVHSRRHGAGA